MTYEHTLAFDSLDLFNRVCAQSTAQEYHSRQVIFAQNDKADAMFYIQSGNVKLTVVSGSGKKAVIAFLRRGDIFGEGCIAKESFRMSTATAIKTSSITRVKRSTVVRIIHREPAFAKLFISYLLSRIGQIQEEFVDQIFNSSEKRLARTLLLLSGVGPESTQEPGLLKVSQETLAEMVGTTRSRVSFFMNRFRKMGLIDYNGSLHVHQSLLSFLQDQV